MVTKKNPTRKLRKTGKARDDRQFCSLRRLTGGRSRARLAAPLCKNKIVQVQKIKKEFEQMAAYAIAYGFKVYTRKNIRNHEDDYTWIADNCYLTNGDYAMFEEILDKEF